MGSLAAAIGRRLKHLRGNTPQVDIAERAGMHQVQYSKYERGERVPSEEVLDRLAAALGCPVSTLIGSTDFFLGRVVDLVSEYRQAARATGDSLKLIAARLGQGTYNTLPDDLRAELTTFEMGWRVPSPDTLEKLAETFNCGLAEIVGDVERWSQVHAHTPLIDSLIFAKVLSSDLTWIDEPGLANGKPINSVAVHADPDEYVQVPHYNIEVSAGPGLINNTEKPVERLAFRRDWIKGKRHLAVDSLAVVDVRGSSMEPELSDGDVVMVDTSQGGVSDDGLYVVRLADSLFVKRCQRLPGHEVKITSTNPEYEPFTINTKEPDEGVSIIGRVVWIGREV